MASELKYRRAVLKLSGESFCSADGFGVDASAVNAAVDEILPLARMGVEIGIVPGGGNFIRARDLADDPHIQRVTADHMGMLGTVINALALRDTLIGRGCDARVMSALPTPTVCEGFNQRRAIGHLEHQRVVIFAGGTGSPFFTTDTTAALRAAEIGAELIVKATKVDGVYDADPVANPAATMFDELTCRQALEQRLGVMDMAAFSLCSDNGIAVIVCRLLTPGNLAKAVRGEKVGTLVRE